MLFNIIWTIGHTTWEKWIVYDFWCHVKQWSRLWWMLFIFVDFLTFVCPSSRFLPFLSAFIGKSSSLFFASSTLSACGQIGINQTAKIPKSFPFSPKKERRDSFCGNKNKKKKPSKNCGIYTKTTIVCNSNKKVKPLKTCGNHSKSFFKYLGPSKLPWVRAMSEHLKLEWL